MLRADINEAVAHTPADIQSDLRGGAAGCLEMLNANLPEDEIVTMLSSAAVRGMDNAPLNWVLALTNRRVVFVGAEAAGYCPSAPCDHKIQVVYGTPAFLFLEGAGAEYSLGIDSSWGNEMEKRVYPAVAAAALAGG